MKEREQYYKEQMDEDGSYSGQTYKEKKLRAFREEVKEDLKRESTPHYEL